MLEIALAIWVAGVLTGAFFAVRAGLGFARTMPRITELATAADALATKATGIEASAARTRAATDLVRNLVQGR